MQVRILTFCREEQFLFGNTLVFKTLRTGFPTADIEVWDNASCPEARREIARQATKADARFVMTEGRTTHADWIAQMVRDAPAGEPLVLVDPDVAFWESVEDLTFPDDTLMAGRLIPRMQVWGAIVEPRLHTSLMFFPDPERVRAFLAGLHPALFDFRPFHGAVYREGEALRHIDTCGPLYSVAKDRCYAFTEKELNRYDHIWMGTSPDYMREFFDAETCAYVENLHAKTRENLENLRGDWKVQEAIFKRNGVELVAPKPPVSSRTPEIEMQLRWAQGNQDAADLMGLFGYATQLADDLVDLDRKWVQTHEGRAEVMSEVLLACLIKIPANPFFHEHRHHYGPLFVSCLGTWEPTVSWAKSPKKETRMFAYVLREATGRLFEMTAFLVGGSRWQRQVVREIHDYYHGSGGVESFEAWEAGG